MGPLRFSKFPLSDHGVHTKIVQTSPPRFRLYLDLICSKVYYNNFQIHCDQVYDNEKEIGNSLSKVFQTGTVKREDVFVTGKLWNTYHRKEDVCYQVNYQHKNYTYWVHISITLSNNSIQYSLYILRAI